MVERNHRIPALAIAVLGGTVDDEDVEFSVVVAINEADAAAHGFHDVFFFGRGDVRNGEAGLLGDVFKARGRRDRRRNSGEPCCR